MPYFTCALLTLLLLNTIANSETSSCYAVYEIGVPSIQQNIIENRHNAIRLEVARGLLSGQPKASNMKRMYWDSSLTTAAQTIADTCVYGHVAVTDSRFSVGQNIYMWSAKSSTPGANWTSAINAWYDEYKTYKYGTTQYNHYTQIVWANTMYIGCGYAQFKDSAKSLYKKYYVCNYGPAGNYVGQTPYNVGQGCDNLC